VRDSHVDVRRPKVLLVGTRVRGLVPGSACDSKRLTILVIRIRDEVDGADQRRFERNLKPRRQQNLKRAVRNEPKKSVQSHPFYSPSIPLKPLSKRNYVKKHSITYHMHSCHCPRYVRTGAGQKPTGGRAEAAPATRQIPVSFSLSARRRQAAQVGSSKSG